MRAILLSCLLIAAGCSPEDATNEALPANAAAPAAEANQQVAAPALPPAEPIPPGEPGGLPDDRTPVSEAPFAETSAQGAANVVQTYFALAEAGRWDEATPLWRDPAAADAFRDRFGGGKELHARIGAPGEIEGAAGSLYVDVPVQLYGRDKDGKAFATPGRAVLRRINDVPGSTAEQRKWHIAEIAI